MNHLKSHFPALFEKPTAYLDSASSCQTPAAVIEAINQYLQNGHGNPHRGMYEFSEKADALVKSCRQAVAKFVHAEPEQIIFTSGTTEAINLVARSLETQIDHRHSVLVTELEHHANLLPWQRLCDRTGANLQILKINTDGELNLQSLEELLAKNCAIFAFTHLSNLTGYSPPIKKMLQLAKHYHVPTLIDGAQAVAHQKVNLQELECDYYAFSAHKLYGVSGTGVLFSRNPEQIEPLLLGGGIVNRVTDKNYQLVTDIHRFEAGSSNIIGIIGLVSALKFITQFSFAQIQQNEKALVSQLRDGLINTNYQVISHSQASNIVSVVHDQFHSHDIASILASEQVAVRAGHHCAQPYLTALKQKHCVRISFAMYNSPSDIEQCLNALNKVPKILG